MRRPVALGPAEDQHVLLGQVILRTKPLEADGAHLLPGLYLAHPVQALDRHRRILGPVLDEHEQATRNERTHQGLAHLPRVGELVVGVDDQDQVDPGSGQVRIGHGTEHGTDVLDPRVVGARLEEREHLGLDVHGEHLSVGHPPRDREGEVARACTDVRHDVVRLQRQPFDEQIRALHQLAHGPIEPAGGAVPHDVRDLAAQVDLADAVGVGQALLVVLPGRDPGRPEPGEDAEEKRQGEGGGGAPGQEHRSDGPVRRGA